MLTGTPLLASISAPLHFRFALLSFARKESQASKKSEFSEIIPVLGLVFIFSFKRLFCLRCVFLEFKCATVKTTKINKILEVIKIFCLNRGKFHSFSDSFACSFAGLCV